MTPRIERKKQVRTAKYQQILFWTARYGDCCRAAQWLLDHGTDAGMSSHNGRSALLWAAETGQLAMVRLLLNHGAPIDRPDKAGQTPLMTAGAWKHTEVFRTLLSHGADVHAQDRSRRTALHQAAASGQADLAALLLKKGAAVDAQNSTGATPLMEAAKAGFLVTVRCLIKHGANVKARTQQGDTALIVAADAEIQLCLLEKGADVNAQGFYGWSALTRAAAYGKLDSVKLLSVHGANLEMAIKSRETALLLAVQRRHGDMAEFLLRKGADASAKDFYGRTVIKIAQDAEDKEMLHLLNRYGANRKRTIP